MANRIYFANQQVAFRRDGVQSGAYGPHYGNNPAQKARATVSPWIAAHGVQSAAVTTTFNLEQAFELGQLSIYENIEGIPDIEVSLTKVLDGYPLLYHLATNEIGPTGGESAPYNVDGTALPTTHPHAPTLAGRSNAKCLVSLGIWPDTQDQAEGDFSTNMEASGMFCSSISYNFPLEDNFTEDVTVVGNNKAWRSNESAGVSFLGCADPPWVPYDVVGAFDGSDVPKASGSNLPGGWAAYTNNDPQLVSQQGNVNRRENMNFATSSSDLADITVGYDYVRIPNEIPGVDSAGWISPRAAGTSNEAHVQSITVSTDLGREELFELGTRQPYARIVTFPVEVTCDIEMLSLSGDMIQALADGCSTSTAQCTAVTDNLTNQTIRVAACEGTRIFLGDKNKLASVNYGGGDAGGGNVTVTYSYTTFNDFTVLHPQDPNASGSGWWAVRSGYLQTLGTNSANGQTWAHILPPTPAGKDIVQ